MLEAVMEHCYANKISHIQREDDIEYTKLDSITDVPIYSPSPPTTAEPNLIFCYY